MTWPMVKLGDVLTHRKEFIRIDDFVAYKRCRVQVNAQGVVLRDQVPGTEIKTKNQQVCKAGEFLVAEIDAKQGGYGIVPDHLAGAIVSSHYFLFGVIEEKLDSRFLGWFIRTPAFREQVAAQGSTNYAAIRPGHVLEYKIPLPPLAEQRRLVAFIDDLATKVDEAKRLRQEADEGIDNLCRSFFRVSDGNPLTPTPMSELVQLRAPDVTVETEKQYHFAGVYCFGRGVFVGQRKTSMEFKYPRLTTLQTGNFVYPKLMAWEGALAVVPPECNGLVVSTEFPVFKIDENKVLPEVIDIYFRTPAVWPELSGSSTGTNMRRQRLNPSDFLKFKFPLPTMPIQRKMREIKSRCADIATHRGTTTPALDALFPAILDRAFRGEL